MPSGAEGSLSSCPQRRDLMAGVPEQLDVHLRPEEMGQLVAVADDVGPGFGGGAKARRHAVAAGSLAEINPELPDRKSAHFIRVERLPIDVVVIVEAAADLEKLAEQVLGRAQSGVVGSSVFEAG